MLFCRNSLRQALILMSSERIAVYLRGVTIIKCSSSTRPSARPPVRPPARPKAKKGVEEPSAPARGRREPASDVNAGTCLTNCIDHHHIDTVFIYKGNKGAEEPSTPARVRREPASDVNAPEPEGIFTSKIFLGSDFFRQ